MKYKLIKEYPGSPKLNDIATDQGSKEWYRINDSSLYVVKDCHKYPEFWKEYVEKDYEILSLNNPQYYLESSRLMIIKGYSSEGFEAKLKEHRHLQIHSVKRLSDGEIFTIGDKILGHTLQEIFTAPSNKNDLVLSCKGLKRALYLIDDKHLKIDSKLLFTTEDGVDIFPESSFIRVDSKNYTLWDKELIHNVNEQYDKKENWDKRGILHFSTKEKAEEYIFLNKPCLSLNDVASIFVSATKEITNTTSLTAQNRRIQELVKSKIK